ncbi:amidohydrolase family protein [Tsukamurella sp. 1534]|uniref:amidohydrolase family protein n=1 Tax=Tsukamurella sp. 1534 TaxID=1151061 RepID=UPI00030C0DA6|nr:amidohydrolase family protein [Tsukamurella sp. 1534]
MSMHFSGVVFPGGEHAEFWVSDGAVTFEPAAADVELTGYAVPGYVDAHCHVGIVEEGEPDLVRGRALALEDVAVGVTVIREPGSDLDTSPLDGQEGLPRFVRMGRHIALVKRYTRGLGEQLEDPSQLVDAVRHRAAEGHPWIKLVGDWIDRDAGDLAPLWPDDVLAEAITLAHDAGAQVTAHVFGEDALPGLLDAGIDAIEHGSGLTDDTIDVMVERGIGLVPTMIQVENFPSIAAPAVDKYPVYARHMQALHDRREETYRKAWEAGVAMYAGTDAGGFNPHGALPREIAALAAVMPPEEAIAAASWRARQWLGFAGIEQDAPADLVVYATDPRRALADGALPAPSAVVVRGELADLPR